MPSIYRCAKCGLGLEVGWFHGFSPFDVPWAATLGFCRHCGTIHQLLHSRTGGPDHLVSQSAPLTTTKSNLRGIAYSIPLGEWRDTEAVDRCAHCGTIGQICFDAAATVEACPRCGSKRVANICTWMT